jgi:hypothetical protein
MKLKLTILGMLLLLSIPQQALGDETLICESSGDRYSECRVRNMRDKEVFFDHQLSKSACTEGYSWGLTSRGVWVDKGCRARFRVSYYDRDYDRDYDNDYYDNDHRRRRYREREERRRDREEIRQERDAYRDALERERQRRQAIERVNENQQNNDNIIRPKCPAGTKFTGRTCKITDPRLKKPGGDGNINPCPKGMWLSGDRCVPD